MGLERFIRKPVMGIIRGVPSRCIKPLSGALINSGLETVEITMNTAGAEDKIAELRSETKNGLCVGAGTVLSLSHFEKAIKAGAEFIVTPVFIQEVADACAEKNVPFFPGAFTPGEIYQAWGAGACMVKVFPSSTGGPEHIKSVKGPFDGIKLMAVGGISSDNLEAYISSGADAVAFGASIFKPDLLCNGEYGTIEKNIRTFVNETLTYISKYNAAS